MMNHTSFVDIFDRLVTDITKYLPADFIQYIKEKIESQKNQLFNSNGNELKINIVIDTNVAISAIKYFVENKQSIIFHLEKNPLFGFYAPHELKNEVQKYIDSNVDYKLKKQWLEGLKRLEKTIHFVDITDSRIKKQAMRMIGKRDKKDTPFVEASIEIGAQGILTFDKDFEQDGIKMFNLNDLENIVCTFQKGIFSFFIVNDSLEIIVKLLMDLILVLFSKIFKIFKCIFEEIKTLIMETPAAIAKYVKDQPLWVKLLVGILIAKIGTSRNIRDTLTKQLNEIASEVNTIIKNILVYAKKILESLKKILASVIPYATPVITLLDILLKNITNMEKEFKAIIYETIVPDTYG